MLSGDKIGGWMALLAHYIEDFIRELLTILTSFSAIPSAFGQTISRIVFTPVPGHLTVFLLLCVCAVLVLLPQPILRRRPYQPPWVSQSPFAILLGAVLNDALSLATSILLAGCSAAIFFDDPWPLDDFAVGLLWAVTRWRIAMLGIDIFLRPGRPQMRLLPLGEANSRTMTWLMGFIFGLALTFVSIVPVLLMHDLPLQPARALALVLAAIEIPLCLIAARSLAHGIPEARGRIRLCGFAVALLFWLSWVGSVVALDFTFYDALTELLAIAWVIIAVYQLGRLALRSPRIGISDHDDRSGTLPVGLVINCIRRCLLVVGIAVGVLFNARRWAVAVTGLIAADRWPTVAASLGITAFTAVAGYIGYDTLQTWSAVRFGSQTTRLGFAADEEEAPHVGSRLATVLPILSRVLLFTFIALAIILGLSNYGVNIAPLLAGAGIFGLALSFGSQALVRDIVSGFFFIVDDAFRVGEYIDTGRLKGTVERISLRSFRLRHQNGQVHTVPYGQLGAVTNFSRDWSTIKFNLRLARNTDLERVRRIAKRLGQDMLADPEIGQEFLAPLKLQGIADISENALVLRFKFTVRPTKVSIVQREAIKRLYASLRADNIEFAVTSVLVSTDSRAPDAEIAAAAHEVVRLAPPPA
jgi:moderate conductance mechanosensitive channel